MITWDQGSKCEETKTNDFVDRCGWTSLFWCDYSYAMIKSRSVRAMLWKVKHVWMAVVVKFVGLYLIRFAEKSHDMKLC